MAIVAVTEQEMVSISEPWVRRGSPARNLIENLPLLALLLPQVEAAHAAVSAVHLGRISNATQINTAMIGWLQMANGLVAHARLADISPEADRLLFSAFRTARDHAASHGRIPKQQAMGDPRHHE